MYDGIEIDMLALGDADSILVTHWVGGRSTRILIDGGTGADADTVIGFLAAREVYALDHMVCTHPHNDHAGGLVELIKNYSIKIGMSWVHDPETAILPIALAQMIKTGSKSKALQEATAAAECGIELRRELKSRNYPLSEPFAGMQIGPLVVCGPSREYYAELVRRMADDQALAEYETASKQQLLKEAFGDLMAEGKAASLLDNPVTTPENNSSTILATVVNGMKHVFTGDAGVEAIGRAQVSYNLSNCEWLQLPHHGSRHNITVPLIEYFRPKIAYVSAVGDIDHPRRAVVNALKATGTTVYSTHYPEPGHLHHRRGTVPARSGYGQAYPLYDAP
jgi:beta-lactamase superfamily II metal-dependent hydrolase